MLKHITAAAVIGLMLAGPVAAQTRQTPEARVTRQRALMATRIRQGVRAGQLTRDEVAMIRQRLQAFRAEAQRLRANGTLTREDRQALRQQWRQISRLVYRSRHN
jgi:hypothetical protein